MRMRLMFGIVLILLSERTLADVNNTILNVNNQAILNVGYLPTQINNAPPLDNSKYLKGHQLSLETRFTKTFYQHFYTQIALNAEASNLSYGLNTPRTSATSVLEQAGLRFGYTFFPRVMTGITPYLATGYQYWQLDTGGAAFKQEVVDKHKKAFYPVIIDGSTKFYQNGYIGIGLLSQFTLSPKLVANLDILLGKTIHPWMRYNAPHVPNKSIGTSIIYQTAQLLPQPFYQLGASIDYSVTPTIHANAGVQYKHIQYSSAVTTASEIRQPHLSIAEWNYNVGVGYSFDTLKSIDDITLQNSIADAIVKSNNQGSLWLGYVCQSYAETVPGMGHYFDRQAGNMPVINMALTKTFERIYTQLNLSLGGGGTAYIGEFSGSNAAFDNGTRNTLFDAGARLGYMFPIYDKASLTPYFAGGFHRWLRDFGGGADGGFIVDGYPETYQHAWYAIGLLAQYTPYPHWVFAIDGNVGTTQNAQNRSWSSLFPPPHTYQQVCSLKQRFVYNIGVSSDYRFAQNWHALAEINYLYFKYGESPTSVLGLDEPNSTTRQLSLLFGIGYAFG